MFYVINRGPPHHFNPFLPTIQTFAVRDTDVCRHNGGTRGSPIMPRDVSLSDSKFLNGGHEWDIIKGNFIDTRNTSTLCRANTNGLYIKFVYSTSILLHTKYIAYKYYFTYSYKVLIFLILIKTNRVSIRRYTICMLDSSFLY